jgi:hypothetical protein
MTIGSCRALYVTCVLAGAVVACDSMSRPSESEVRQCLGTTRSGIEVTQVEFGNTITSQGGMVELSIGAPRDTKMFPVNVHSPSGSWTLVTTYWVFNDSFGELKCTLAPGAESRRYQTAAQVAQEAERQRVAAQQAAEQQRIRAEQQRREAEQQRLQAEAHAQRDLQVSRTLVGTWKDENSTMTYSVDGARSTNYDDGSTNRATWVVRNGILSETFYERNGKSIREYTNESKIVDITSSTMTKTQYDASGTPRTWQANRVN